MSNYRGVLDYTGFRLERFLLFILVFKVTSKLHDSSSVQPFQLMAYSNINNRLSNAIWLSSEVNLLVGEFLTVIGQESCSWKSATCCTGGTEVYQDSWHWVARPRRRKVNNRAKWKHSTIFYMRKWMQKWCHNNGPYILCQRFLVTAISPSCHSWISHQSLNKLVKCFVSFHHHNSMQILF